MRLRLLCFSVVFLLAAGSLWHPASGEPQPATLLVTTEDTVWSVSTNGKDTRSLGEMTWMSDADWGPGGDRIVYGGTVCWPTCAPVHGTPHRTEMHTVGADGSDDRTLFTLPLSHIWSVDWSPDGRWLAYTAATGYSLCWGCPPAWSLHLRDLQRGVQVALGPATDVEWSPDSTRLAFVHPGGINVVDVIEGAVPTRVVATQPGASSPSWSPDGRLLAFISTDEYAAGFPGGGLPGLWVMRADGTNPRSLGVRTFEPATWSPNSRSVAAIHAEGKRLVLARVDGSSRRVIHLPAGWSWNASWSPDGRSVAYVHQSNSSSWPPSGHAVRLVGTNGRGHREIFAPSSWIIGPIRWQPSPAPTAPR